MTSTTFEALVRGPGSEPAEHSEKTMIRVPAHAADRGITVARAVIMSVVAGLAIGIALGASWNVGL